MEEEGEEAVRGTVIGYPILYYQPQTQSSPHPHPQPTNTAAATTTHSQPTNTAAATTTTAHQPTNTAVTISGIHVVRVPPPPVNVNNNNNSRGGGNSRRLPPPSPAELNRVRNIIWSVVCVVIFTVMDFMIVNYYPSYYDNPEFQVNVSGGGRGGGGTNSNRVWDWDIVFDIKNPNSRTGFSYDEIRVSLFSDKKDDKDDDYEFLSGTMLPPFHQPKKNTTLLHANLVAMSSTNSNTTTEPSPLLSYKVRFESNFTAHARGCRGQLTVNCDDVKIGLPSTTLMTSTGFKECNVFLIFPR